MLNSASEYLGGNAVVVDEPGVPWILRVPEGWEVDTSGAKDGALVARDSEAESMGFHPNATLMVSSLPEDFTGASIDEALDDQHTVDSYYREELDGYRLVDLAIQHMGLEPEPAVYRLALYNTADEVPVMMAQFISRACGQESTLTVTWATADSRWIGNSQAIAYCLERKVSQ